jgi:hypothetical protein
VSTPSPVYVSLEEHVPKHLELCCLILRLECDVGAVPVTPHSIPTHRSSIGARHRANQLRRVAEQAATTLESDVRDDPSQATLRT